MYISKIEELRRQIRPTPLSVFLEIYNKARHESYIDYMYGAKLLYTWLSPIDIPNTSEIDSIIIHNYEINELATILSGKQFGPEHKKARNAIINYEVRKWIRD